MRFFYVVNGCPCFDKRSYSFTRVKLWKDTRYCLWNVFRRSRPSTDSEKGRETMLEGVVVTSQTNTRTYATR